MRLTTSLHGVWLLVLCSGCIEAPMPVTSVPPRETQPLAEARQGFHTKLVRKIARGLPLPEPPEHLFRKVQYPSPAGMLGAYLTVDDSSGQKRPAIIWITGGDCNTLDQSVWDDAPPENDQTARAFREAGIVMMFPTLRGGNDNPGFHESFFGEVDDILAAADFLAAQENVDPDRIYLGGHSSGGTMVLLVAECSKRFRAVFAIGPAANMRRFPPEFQVFMSSDREFNLRSPDRWLHCIQSPTIVIEGEAGGAADLQAMSKSTLNPRITFIQVGGADHFTVLGPTNHVLAEKILADQDEQCNIKVIPEELTSLFMKSRN